MRADQTANRNHGAGLLFAIVASLTLLGVALAVGTPRAEAAFPGQNGKIAFDAIDASGDSEIYTVNPDGTGRAPLTANGVNDFEPAYSPDGQRIVFARTTGAPDFDTDVWVMNADGTGETNLAEAANITFTNIAPAFSGDGSRIFFTGFDGTDFDVWAMNADGTGQAPVTTGGEDLEPTSSPNAQRIAFFRDVRPPAVPAGEFTNAIFAGPDDGSAETLLTPINPDPNEVFAEGPNFSPDGSLLTFSRCTDPDEGCFNVPPEIVTRSSTDPSTASPMTEVTSSGANDPWDLDPVFSPDGTRIAFQRGTDAPAGDSIGIFTVGAGGGAQPQLLTFQQAGEANPDWQPVAGSPPQPQPQPQPGPGVTQQPGGTQPTPREGGRCFGVPATILGTNGRDVLRGTPGRDVIHGREGRDVIRGLGGNDRLCGGRGRDRIVGGTGRDVVIGGDHRDFLSGGAGADRIFGGTPGAPDRRHIDTCSGGNGNDRLRNCERRR